MKDERKMDASRLIAEVYKRPALWNQRHLSYHNRDATNRIWMEIAMIFKLPKQVLKTKWKGLRDTFRAEIKKEQVYKKSKYTSNRPAWIHFKTLQFLKEQMLPRPPIWERNDDDNSRDDDKLSSSGAIDVDGHSTNDENLDDIHFEENEKLRNIEMKNSIDDNEESWMEIKTKEAKCSMTNKKIVTNYYENLVILENLAEESNETNAVVVDSIKEQTFDSGLISSNSPRRNNNNRNSNNSNNSNSNDNQMSDIAIIKLEPVDNYDNNAADEYRNITEIDDIDDDRGLIKKKIGNEEVMVGESSGGNCVIGSQNPIDPLDVNNRFDDNYYFLMSLLPHIRTLPAERRMLLRMQMQQLVYQEVYNKIPSSSPSTSFSSH